MSLWDFLPAEFPKPPIPRGLLPPFPPKGRREEEAPVEVEEGGLDRTFKMRLGGEGFDPKLIEMGLKVANNHSRSREEALKIGEAYIREMGR